MFCYRLFSQEEFNLIDVSVLKEHRLPRYLKRIEQQTEFESQRLWAKVSDAIARDDQVHYWYLYSLVY